MDSLATDRERKAAVLETLAGLYPWMKPFYSRPLRDYASRLYAPVDSGALPECRRQALQRLLASLHKAALRAGLSTSAAAEICREFEERRVLQTGPHLLLLLEPEAFGTHVFSLLGLSAHGCSSYVSYAVSTMSLAERARKGPGWLSVDGKAINVFGLSRGRMIGYSLLTASGPYRFELAPADEEAPPAALDHLRSLLPQAVFERPAQAIKAANRSLWPRLFGDRFAFLQLDDEDTADLVADHLSDDTSWLRTRLFGTPRLAAGILEAIDRLATGPWAGWLTRGTDFFWSYEDGKRAPLRLAGDELVHHANGAKVATFAPADIVEKLLNRSLIPNMFLGFLVLAILPGVRVLGGSHQPIYYPLMRYVLCRALAAAGIDADLRDALAVDDLPGAWGHRVIENGAAPMDLLTKEGSGDSWAMIGAYGDTALIDACGSMNGFIQDDAWLGLSERLAQRAIAVSDAEWAMA